MARNGIELKMGLSETPEHFNIVVLYVSDFSHVKETLGRVQITAGQGCTLCNRPAVNWHKPQKNSRGQSELGKIRDFKELSAVGAEAERHFSENPDKKSSSYNIWYNSYDGKTAHMLLYCLCAETVPPCALHQQISFHRCLWQKIQP